MNAILVLGGLAVVLFFASLLSKRRFGALGLALAAGVVLSSFWDSTVSLIVSLSSVVPEGSWNDAIAKSLVILAPAIILLFHGVTYKSLAARIFGSVFFTALALTFLATPLAPVLATDSLSKMVISWLQDNYSPLVSLGLIIAVGDLFLTKPSRKHDDEKKSKH